MNVHEMWSDNELDRALTTLHSDVATDNNALAGARAGLMVATGGTGAEPSTMDISGHGQRWTRWAVAVAAVVVLVAGFLVVQTVQLGKRSPAASAAGEALNMTADKIHTSDPPVGPGQYRYVATHAWWMNTAMLDRPYSYLAENLLETWVPADQSQEWLLRRNVTGARTWVQGTEAEARAAGVPVDEAGWPQGEWRARCGDFYAADEGKQPCTEPGGWQRPNPQWLAGLPREPQQLFDRLRADSPRNDRGDAEMLVYAADALRSGLIPADLRAAIYRALAKLPGLEITDQQANLDGRVGIAYAMRDGNTRQEIIIDPATGEFIGEREVTTRDLDGMPANTVMSYTSVTTAVVDSMGAKPPA